ncbi:unnamed protein product [Prorocentrum cordatum]|uniref:EF-hand domain-containing protein n=1 Tax=Prorocentrum cordatum TaxID=2364126 RepID=A0ABN9SWP2_9DINO|nr:unnamed protein product [Polarella glacialis]|mmetsp:Transcript_43395/g.116313  ORF Transcript_43395/g.116313 Transcript_43395/m.116313 type:complete len:200 (-) Transcript_43395:111-710(-)
MVSLFELMLANWPPICRLMMETMDEVWSVFVILYKLLMGVAVIGVNMGVFTQDTFRAADSDDQFMIRSKDKQDKTHLAKMKALFEKMTKNSECATVDSALFEKTLKSPEMRLWLKAMDYDISDASLLFYLIDSNDDGKLTIEEFSQGMAALKGGARNVDVKLLLRQSRVGRMLQSSRNIGDAKMSRMSTVEALRRFEMP